MNIFFYDLIRGKNIGTESTHIYEVLNNIINQGHNVLLYHPVEQRFNRASIVNTKPNCWGNLALTIPIIGICLSYAAEVRFFLRAIFLLRSEKKKIDIVYYRHTLFNFGYWLARWLRVPAIKEVNGIVANEMQVTGEASGFALEIINRIERATIGKANRIIVVTSKLKETLIDEYNVPEESIEVIENGANTDMFRPMHMETAKKELNLNPEHSYVCFIGNFTGWQGLEYLIKCAPHVLKACPDARFLMVGDGILKGRLSEMARELGISEMVIFTDMVPYEKVPLYINASEVCVVPKKHLKSGYSPLKLYEYLACEKAVVASKVEGFECLEEQKAGVLVEPENPDELAKAIIKLMKDEKLRNEMGRNGREYVVKNHSWESIARQIADVFRASILLN
ncbi:MAG: glycosyltransferase family 4 protein [Candidatus Methanoperedens sp.]